MVVIFYILCIVGFIYFFVRERVFDFFSIAYISAIVYFMPGFFGYTFLPGWFKIELLLETYIVMCLVISSIIVSALVFDNFSKDKKNSIKYDFEKSKYIYIAIFIITFISFIMMMLTMGSSLFLADKKEMMVNINSWSKIWENAVCIGAVISFSEKKVKSFIFYLVMLAFIMFIGDRTIPAISLISIMAIIFNSQGKQKILFSRFKLVLISLVFAVFFFVYKYLYINIKLKMWTQVIEKIMNPNFYIETIKFSEPFAIQTILNEVMRQDFYVGIDHFTGLFNQLIPFANKLGASSTTFNSLFQTQLFPGVTYGMGSNIWAEMWSAGGWGLLLIFIIIFNVVLYIGNKLFKKSYGSLRNLLVITLSFWSFYIHRSSLEYTVNLNKRIFLLWIVGLVFSIMISSFSNRKIANKKVEA